MRICCEDGGRGGDGSILRHSDSAGFLPALPPSPRCPQTDSLLAGWSPGCLSSPSLLNAAAVIWWNTALKLGAAHAQRSQQASSLSCFNAKLIFRDRVPQVLMRNLFGGRPSRCGVPSAGLTSQSSQRGRKKRRNGEKQTKVWIVGRSWRGQLFHGDRSGRGAVRDPQKGQAGQQIAA